MPNPQLSTIKALQSCIHEDFLRKGNGNFFEIRDLQSGQLLKIDFSNKPIDNAVCFVIDIQRCAQNQQKPAKDPVLPFINPTLKGVTKKNDATLIMHDDKFVYVFLIEMKMARSSGSGKQMQTGKIIIEFLFNLLKLHGHCCESIVPRYYGVICLKRKTVPLGTTDRKNAVPINTDPGSGFKSLFFNDENINAGKLLNAAKRNPY